VKAAFSAIEGGAGTALSVGGTVGGMKELVRDKSPAELKGIIGKRLDEIGVQGVIRESFLDNEHYNPQERLLLVGELAAMEGVDGRDVFVHAAATAPSETVALFMRVQVQMMARHAQERPVARMLTAGSVVFLQERDGAVAGFLPLDHVRWTPNVAHRMSLIEKDLADAGLNGGRTLMVLGNVSGAAREALQERGWTVKDMLLKEFCTMN
jgi:hypothetical protein